MNQKNGKNSLGLDKCFEETNNPIQKPDISNLDDDALLSLLVG